MSEALHYPSVSGNSYEIFCPEAARLWSAEAEWLTFLDHHDAGMAEGAIPALILHDALAVDDAHPRGLHHHARDLRGPGTHPPPTPIHAHATT